MIILVAQLLLLLVFNGCDSACTNFRRVLASTSIAVSSLMYCDVAHVLALPDERPKYSRSSTGIEYYEYKVGDGPAAKYGDKIVWNYKGRLAGRQGWVFDDTFQEGKDPVRMVLGTTNCIEGLEIGIAGDKNEDAEKAMPAMRKGGKRRLVIPARLGYMSTDQLPIPSEFGQRQRLYGTVLNPVRGDREREALGDSLAGRLVLDVELLRVSSPR